MRHKISNIDDIGAQMSALGLFVTFDKKCGKNTEDDRPICLSYF